MNCWGIGRLIREEHPPYFVKRTIQASLAIEHNSLTTGQVTAIMEGKRVLAPEKDIQEVRNAIVAYEHLSGWKPWERHDLLYAHRLLMTGMAVWGGSGRR